jgi:peroxiredoxin 6
VCTTELGRVAGLAEEFAKRNTKVCALSCNDAASHAGWIADINASQGVAVEFPIIADADRAIATAWGMLDMAEDGETDAVGMPMTVRSVFIVSPDKSLKLMLAYPASTGRNFDEIIRVLDSLQLTANAKVATPVDWQQGDRCMVLPTIKADQFEALYPKGVTIESVPSGKEYLRHTPQPQPGQ